jgi:hypothetical protein
MDLADSTGDSGFAGSFFWASSAFFCERPAPSLLPVSSRWQVSSVEMDLADSTPDSGFARSFPLHFQLLPAPKSPPAHYSLEVYVVKRINLHGSPATPKFVEEISAEGAA